MVVPSNAKLLELLNLAYGGEFVGNQQRVQEVIDFIVDETGDVEGRKQFLRELKSQAKDSLENRARKMTIIEGGYPEDIFSETDVRDPRVNKDLIKRANRDRKNNLKTLTEQSIERSKVKEFIAGNNLTERQMFVREQENAAIRPNMTEAEGLADIAETNATTTGSLRKQTNLSRTGTTEARRYARPGSGGVVDFYDSVMAPTDNVEVGEIVRDPDNPKRWIARETKQRANTPRGNTPRGGYPLAIGVENSPLYKLATNTATSGGTSLSLREIQALPDGVKKRLPFNINKGLMEGENIQVFVDNAGDTPRYSYIVRGFPTLGGRGGKTGVKTFMIGLDDRDFFEKPVSVSEFSAENTAFNDARKFVESKGEKIDPSSPLGKRVIAHTGIDVNQTINIHSDGKKIYVTSKVKQGRIKPTPYATNYGGSDVGEATSRIDRGSRRQGAASNFDKTTTARITRNARSGIEPDNPIVKKFKSRGRGEFGNMGAASRFEGQISRSAIQEPMTPGLSPARPQTFPSPQMEDIANKDAPSRFSYESEKSQYRKHAEYKLREKLLASDKRLQTNKIFLEKMVAERLPVELARIDRTSLLTLMKEEQADLIKLVKDSDGRVPQSVANRIHALELDIKSSRFITPDNFEGAGMKKTLESGSANQSRIQSDFPETWRQDQRSAFGSRVVPQSLPPHLMRSQANAFRSDHLGRGISIPQHGPLRGMARSGMTKEMMSIMNLIKKIT
jgi:hypothetical protein